VCWVLADQEPGNFVLCDNPVSFMVPSAFVDVKGIRSKDQLPQYMQNTASCITEVR